MSVNLIHGLMATVLLLGGCAADESDEMGNGNGNGSGSGVQTLPYASSPDAPLLTTATARCIASTVFFDIFATDPQGLTDLVPGTAQATLPWGAAGLELKLDEDNKTHQWDTLRLDYDLNASQLEQLCALATVRVAFVLPDASGHATTATVDVGMTDYR